MNKPKIFYVLSLLIFASSFFLLVQYQESNRMNFIAGMLVVIGFVFNIISYSIMSDKVKTTK